MCSQYNIYKTVCINEAIFSAGNEQFIALCQKAEEYMDSCVLAETSEHYGDALGYCQQAIDHLKYAMRMQNLSQSLYITAQKKSNSCVIKFRSLQKRLMSRQESNTSCNSSDSGINQDYRYVVTTLISLNFFSKTTSCCAILHFK